MSCLLQRTTLAGPSTSTNAQRPLWTPCRVLGRRSLVVRSAYDVDVEPDRSAPSAGPNRWGAPPPPPPPPPPPQKQAGAAPSRREAMFGLLGAGLGVGLTTVFFKTVGTEIDEELLDAAANELLQDPEFLDAVADEILYEQFKNDIQGQEGEGLQDDMEGADAKQ